jgi:hypothetical protein
VGGVHCVASSRSSSRFGVGTYLDDDHVQALVEISIRRYHRSASVSTGGNWMSQEDRIDALKEKHAMLERALDEETHRPLPDQAAIYDLKRQKLRIKDEIYQLEKQ